MVTVRIRPGTVTSPGMAAEPHLLSKSVTDGHFQGRPSTSKFFLMQCTHKVSSALLHFSIHIFLITGFFELLLIHRPLSPLLLSSFSLCVYPNRQSRWF
jgi:hypothetical protein